MKKIIAMLLVLTLGCGLCACMGSTEGSATEATTQAPTVPTTTMPEGYCAQPIALGDTIVLDYATMTLDLFEITEGYHLSYSEKEGNTTTTYNAMIPCGDGMKLICLRGIFTNNSSRAVEPGNNPIFAKLIIDGTEYETYLRCFIVDKAQSMSSVAPPEEAEYYLIATVPADAVAQMTSCQLYIGFVADLDPSVTVESMDDHDALYLLDAMPSAG